MINDHLGAVLHRCTGTSQGDCGRDANSRDDHQNRGGGSQVSNEIADGRGDL